MGNCIGCKVVCFIKIIVAIYDIITLPLYTLIQMPWSRWEPGSKIYAQLRNKADPTSPVTRITKGSNHGFEALTTAYELFEFSVEKYGDQKCLGTRKLIDEREETGPDGKVKRRVKLGRYFWLTYTEINDRVQRISTNLVKLGLTPKKQIAVFAETRMEWFLILHSCFRINVPVATLYSTLGEEGIIHGITETEATTIVTSQDLLDKLKKIIDKLKGVDQIIVFKSTTNVPVDTEGFPDEIKMVNFAKVQRTESEIVDTAESRPPEPEDVAIIMYTSGSTGKPKGVVISHKNMISTLCGICEVLPQKKDCRYLAYLPLAHIYEILIENCCLVLGIAIGYGSPFTLMNTSPGLMENSEGDAFCLRPTNLSCVPLVLDRIQKEVEIKISKQSGFTRHFFSYALCYKHFWLKCGYDCPFMDAIVFDKVKQTFGGDINVIICGSAFLAKETDKFIRTCLSCPVTQGYGLTETSAGATAMSLTDFTYGRVGPPIQGVQIKLVDWEEGGYYPNDKPNPRGEIVVGGDNVKIGYFKNEELTTESYFEENGQRWFRTSDIGELCPDGSYKLIDRKSELIKLRNGKFVSLGKIETELKTAPFVEFLCVVGSVFQEDLFCLAVVKESVVRDMIEPLGKKDMPWEEAIKEEDVKSLVLTKLCELGEKRGLHYVELPRGIHLCEETWTPDNGLVTAAFKNRRKPIEAFYKSVLSRYYERLSIGA